MCHVGVKITGVEDLRKRLEAIGQAKRYVAEVYIEGERNQKLAGYHASPEPRTIMPYRNPFFVQTGLAKRLMDRIGVGLRKVARGEPPTIIEALMSEVGREAAAGMQRNLAAQLSEDTREKAEPIGTGSKMQPLSPAYAKRKAPGLAIAQAASGLRGVSGRRGCHGRIGVANQLILQRTGELMGSIKSRVVTDA